MATSPIKAVVFDFGKVIAFFDHRKACKALAGMTRPPLELTEDQVYEKVFTAGLERQYDCGEISSGEFLNQLRALLGLVASDEELRAAWCDIFWENEPIARAIERLQAHSYRLVLASNTNELHYGWFRAQFRSTLDRFDRLILSYEVNCRKPEPKFFMHCVLAAGCDAGECVYVDDIQDNVDAAAVAGMKGICYGPKVDLARRLAEFGVVL